MSFASAESKGSGTHCAHPTQHSRHPLSCWCCHASGDGAAFGGKVVGASKTWIKMGLGLSRYKNRRGAAFPRSLPCKRWRALELISVGTCASSRVRMLDHFRSWAGDRSSRSRDSLIEDPGDVLDRGIVSTTGSISMSATETRIPVGNSFVEQKARALTTAMTYSLTKGLPGGNGALHTFVFIF